MLATNTLRIERMVLSNFESVGIMPHVLGTFPQIRPIHHNLVLYPQGDL